MIPEHIHKFIDDRDSSNIQLYNKPCKYQTNLEVY